MSAQLDANRRKLEEYHWNHLGWRPVVQTGRWRERPARWLNRFAARSNCSARNTVSRKVNTSMSLDPSWKPTTWKSSAPWKHGRSIVDPPKRWRMRRKRSICFCRESTSTVEGKTRKNSSQRRSMVAPFSYRAVEWLTQHCDKVPQFYGFLQSFFKIPGESARPRWRRYDWAYFKRRA